MSPGSELHCAATVDVPLRKAAVEHDDECLMGKPSLYVLCLDNFVTRTEPLPRDTEELYCTQLRRMGS